MDASLTNEKLRLFYHHLPSKSGYFDRPKKGLAGCTQN